jgi:hypothetical protein
LRFGLKVTTSYQQGCFADLARIDRFSVLKATIRAGSANSDEVCTEYLVGAEASSS